MPVPQFETGCLICGKDLHYSQDPSLHQCFLCGKAESGIVACTDGHFVCDKCHKADSLDVIEKYLNITESVSPFEIADFVMRVPGIKMHGPEHHFIVPGALLSAYYNYKKKGKLKKKAIQYARIRADKVPGGFCGTHGDCGAGVGTGIFMSLMTGATSLSGKEYRQCNMMTSLSLLQIAMNGGPRCCKRNTWIALYEAVKILKEDFKTELPVPEHHKCTFYHMNRECRKEECLFF